MQRVLHTEPEVLRHAFRDFVNSFTREIIVGRKLIGEDQLEILDSDEVRKEIDTIIEHFVQTWQTCTFNDDASAK